MNSKKQQNLPNFLIVGAAKSGTTSLYEYLKQHPEIFMPAWKEPSLFISDPYGPLHRIKKKNYYGIIFSESAGFPAVGEASTSYLYDEASPEIIRNCLGEIKIIIALRDPVQMSYSLYNHQVRKGGETLKTFEAALANENKRILSKNFQKKCYGWHANYYYYHRGLYYEQVKRYLKTFGSSNVMIIFFEELVKNPIKTSQKIYGFLNVDCTFIPAIKIHNPRGSILKIPEFWRDRGLFIKTASFILSKNFIKKFSHLIRIFNQPPPAKINAITEKKLRSQFYTNILKLESLIHQDLSAWTTTKNNRQIEK
jgi:hypothetical protein